MVMIGDGGPLAAAFGAAPDTPVRVAEGAPAVDRWLAAVVLGGQGRYAAAATLLADTRDAAPKIVAHMAVTRASHLRQLGGHLLARRHDARALRLVAAAQPDEPDEHGTDAAAARMDAVVGLAADALGTGALDTAERLLAVAGEHPSWRPSTRACWVRAELALVRGRPADALPPAELAVRLSACSARHHLKSRIIAAVARGVDGGDTVAELDAAAAEAERLGLLPLVWPALLAAADQAERHANDATGGMADSSPNGRWTDAPRRRHAASIATSEITRRSDPIGRRELGVSEWAPRQGPATVITPFGGTSPT